VIPFLLLHLACGLVWWCGVSGEALLVCLASYSLRMFGITAGYHRLLSHRSYRALRPVQFALAWLACSAAQLGPLWWVSHHRHHHSHSDTAHDEHSPGWRGFWMAHAGWIFEPANRAVRWERVRDLARYPELVWLERHWYVPPFLLAMGLATWSWQYFVWGFCISTVLLYHVTFCVNSLAHRVGTRRYETADDSRNNLGLAILTLGEGWHNNHHRFPGRERQGQEWWELDVTHYGLVALSWLGLVAL